MNVPTADEILTNLETAIAVLRQLVEREVAYYAALELVEQIDARLEQGVHVVYRGQRLWRLDDVVREMAQ